ncbi:MAG: helix-turn-helix domain-containing protein [Minwuia sp.]|uniref:helix-turn-helix domain-containing protein n=1 Tax=Minwuia sp. TaxID=2493630 RepID=UPI003A88833C
MCRKNGKEYSLAEHPHPVDIHVGSRVRLCRTLKGLSQQKLAQALGLTFQQVQKYERGANRIGASRLFELSQILEVPPSFFFEGADEAIGDGSAASGLSEGGQAPFDTEQLFRREILELVRAYDRIPEPTVRKRLFELVKAIANQSSEN